MESSRREEGIGKGSEDRKSVTDGVIGWTACSRSPYRVSLSNERARVGNIFFRPLELASVGRSDRSIGNEAIITRNVVVQ